MISEVLNEFASNYISSKDETFKDHPIAEKIRSFDNNIKTSLGELSENFIFKASPGMVGGRTDGVISGGGAYQQSSGLWWQDLLIKGNKTNYGSLGRCVVQYHTNGEIGVTGFFDKGKRAGEALQWTKLFKASDSR